MKIISRFSNYAGLYRRLVLFVALNLPPVFLLLLRNIWKTDLTYLSWLYLFFLSLGYYLLAMLIITSIFFLLGFISRRIAVVFSTALMVLFVYYLLIDGQTYSLTSIHINSFWLEWIINDFKGLGLPASTIPYVLLALVLVVLMEVGLVRLASKINSPKYVVAPFWALTIVALIAGQLIHVVTYENNDIRITGLTPHLPIYTPLTSHSNASRFGNIMPLGDDELPAADEEFKGAFYYPQNEIKLRAAEQTLPNIVVIFLESWRFDMLNAQVTPRIYELSKKSFTSENHFCSGNSTVAGTFGFFYGLDPTYWMAVKANNAVIDNPVLIDVLEQRGYTFGIFAKSNFKRHKLKDTIFRGIDVYEDFPGHSAIEQDRDMTVKFKEFLRTQKNGQKPFFGFVFYKSNHAPYLYPPEDSIFMPAGDQNLLLADAATDPTKYLNDYRNATHYVDRLTGELIDEMNELGLMSNTLIIITTDHGEEFNDNQSNFWGHGSNFTKYQTLVPLVFYAPNRKPIKPSFPTAHIDIAPTLLQEFLFCDNDIGDYSSGINIFKEENTNRPFIIGSYVNYAFVIENNVFEIFPIFTKEYRLDNIALPATAPSPEALKTIVTDMGRFYMEPSVP